VRGHKRSGNSCITAEKQKPQGILFDSLGLIVHPFVWPTRGNLPAKVIRPPGPFYVQFSTIPPPGQIGRFADGRAGLCCSILLSNTWEKTRHFDEKFWLYIVTQAVIDALHLQRIQDPAAYFQLS